MIRTTVVPAHSETKINLNLPESYIGQEVEIIAFTKKEGIRVSQFNTVLSPALEGIPVTEAEFKNWITISEEAPAIPVKEAKAQWASKRKQLQKLIK